MEILIWAFIFIVSVAILVKGADWVLDGAKNIGLSLGMPPFVVGVLIVGFGTSAPELVSSVAGVLKGAIEIPAANAIGSNITNILLVLGIAALLARGKLAVTKNIVDLELPILAFATLLFFGVAYDGVITTIESLFLLVGAIIYLAYTFIHKDKSEIISEDESKSRPRLSAKDILLLVIGMVFLVFGAKYLIDAVIALSGMIGISVGIITILAVAIGTSLPELLVSAKAAMQGNAEVAVGNIFGSNIFNIFLVVGVPGMLGTLVLDAPTLAIGLPVLLAVTFFFIISGLSQRIHTWEGAFYLLAYTLFTFKLLGIV
ncbi:hypothetical protein COU15_02300 [Candidatus Kaiserbacteria bacterium CG10_big_fil_rev_8_21_14_0_10_45_20]|uniref:Sodium/calcium exchanger membrane region domain-containing protein n=1 Tax=Candidatus Kaiserbacteria bacterium CG10_big_fil_rev_8_21_14_0_10_45_20 TaxID=1974607 RepID=A0A2H0UFN3_9BACT|nr:MAG: hypothetical protein COU15_02300 [Candidatus Kaiserbacteria bacterium CG10_big_fil_rev_8_21_14_0_10_45_20]